MSNCCEGLQEQLAALTREVSRVRSEFKKTNQRIEKLEGEFGKLKQGEEKNNDESEILKRLAKAEKDILELGGIITEIIDDVADVLDSVDEHNQNANESQSVLSKILNFFIDD